MYLDYSYISCRAAGLALQASFRGKSGEKTAAQQHAQLAPNPRALEMPPATRRAVRDATNLLTATPDEAAIIIACALTNPKDLLRLARACRRFATKCIAAPAAHRTAASGGGGTAAAAQQAEMWSIIEEAARRWIATCTDHEHGWVPRRGRESWLGLMWEVQSLRRAAVLGRSNRNTTLSENGSLATRTMAAVGAVGYPHGIAASKVVMRAGRHYAQFTVVSVEQSVVLGVIRPGWDVELGRGGRGRCGRPLLLLDG